MFGIKLSVGVNEEDALMLVQTQQKIEHEWFTSSTPTGHHQKDRLQVNIQEWNVTSVPSGN